MPQRRSRWSGLFGRVGEDGIAVDDALDLEGYLRRVGYPVFGVALVDFEEPGDGMFRVVTQLFWHVLLDLRVEGDWVALVEGVVGVVDAGGHAEIEGSDGDCDYACGLGEHE